MNEIKRIEKLKPIIIRGMRIYAAENNYPSFDEKKYFKTYIDFLKSSERVDTYLSHSSFRRNLMSGGDKEETISKIYGVDAYLIARAIEEGRKVKFGNLGMYSIDGEFLLAPFMYPEKRKDDFTEEEEELPNIDDYYRD